MNATFLSLPQMWCSMDSINRDSRLPLYTQLYDILRAKITSGEWAAGEMIPPEHELIDCHQLSRTTVRQTLDLLVNEGLIYRQRGRGTFVAHPPVEQALLRIISFTDDMRQRGFEPSTEVLFSGLVPAPKEIAENLRIAPGEELARLERLRLADGEPMSVEESFLVHRLCPGVLEGDYASNPLRIVLERDYGIRWMHAKQVIRAILPSARLADLLSVSSHSAVLFIERVSYSLENIPVEFLHIYYRGDGYALYSELTG
jgi:GntR family transcriptional regulator